jgi:hypothetical protein
VARLKAMPERINREVESLLKQEARVLATEIAHTATPPFGFDEPIAWRMRIAKEVRQVFGSFDGPHNIFEAIKKRNRGAAAGFIRAYRKKDYARMQKIAASFGIVPGITKQVHRAARTGRKASVPRNHEPVRIGKESEVERYVAQRMRFAGLVKAGWYVAAKSMGGRIRRVIYTPGGKRSTEERFPAWIRKLARVGNLGSSRFSGSGTKMRVTLTNHVRYASEAVDRRNFSTALAHARENFVKALQRSIREIARGGRRGRRAA